MFKKLLSHLPFNPSLINQLSFYAKRVHREAFVRSVGFALMILAMLVQLFAVISPPQPSLAYSSNDLIGGGFANQEQAVEHCNNDDFDFHDVLGHFRISCGDLARASTKEIKADDYGGKLYTYGRKAVGDEDPRTHKHTDEGSIEVKGENYYGRKLTSWDRDDHKKYKALVGKTDDGKDFVVLYNCGGVSVPEKPKPTPPPEPPKPHKPPTTKDQDKCPYLPGLQTKSEDCKPCPQAQNDNDDLACLSFSKTAANLTSRIDNASGLTAKGGDEIKYTLRVHNSGKVKVTKYLIEENLGDVLEYATLNNTGSGSLNQNNLSWSKTDIQASQTVSKTFTVKIKNPVPSTPVSKSDPSAYDLIMTNVYGNTINIKLPASAAKVTEATMTSLPDTGPGPGIFIVFIITSIIGYFYYRSRLMAKELDIVREEFNSSGGY
ncbi:MAG TPA: hypothetical protein VLF39_03305 [Candidatus Saccharimonadales bacterium]|nr:hypothetical protein [Candidatus Saccharimonadales bacterium]